MRVQIIKDFEIEPGRVLPKGETLTLWMDDAKRAINGGFAVDLSGKYKQEKQVKTKHKEK